MDNLVNNIINIIGTIGAICSIISAIPLIISTAKNKSKADDPINQQKQRRVYFIVIASWFIIMLLISAISIVSKWNNYALIITIIPAFLLLIYGIRALQSFDSINIFPPKPLWQVLFNKIPSWIKNSDQTSFNFLVLKMDDTEEVQKAAEVIEKSYPKDKSSDFHIEIQPCFDGIVPMEIRDDFCGMICLIGKEGRKNLGIIESSLEKCSNQPDNLDLPIAYSCIGCDPIPLKYEQIGENQLNRFAQSLIMRSYSRSKEWIHLCERAHRTLIAAIVFIFVGSIVLGSMKHGDNNKISELMNSIEILEKNKPPHYIMPPPMDYAKEFDISLKGLNIDSIMKDENLKDYFSMVYKYAFKFKGIASPEVKVWYRPEPKKDLRNILTTEKSYNNSNKGKHSIIGGIADNRVFLFWPGVKNFNRDNTIAWDISGVRNDSIRIDKNFGENIGFTVFGPKKREFNIEWEPSPQEKETDKGLVIYGFSYNELLAIEFDFSSQIFDTNAKDVFEYIQTPAFRDEVRKYYLNIAKLLERYVDASNKQLDNQ